MMKKYNLELLYSLDTIQVSELEKVITESVRKHVCEETQIHFKQSGGGLSITFIGSKEKINSIHQVLSTKFPEEYSFIRLVDELGDSLRIEAYPIISRIEQQLRRFIQTAMIENMGFEWWVLISDSSIVSRVTELEGRSSKGVHHHPIEFSEFSHLLELVTTNLSSWESSKSLTVSDLSTLLEGCETIIEVTKLISKKLEKKNFWDDVFSLYFEDKQLWTKIKISIAKDIIPIRNKVMHHRPLFVWELEKLCLIEKNIKNILSIKHESLSNNETVTAIQTANELGAEVVKREFLNQELSDEFRISKLGGVRLSRKNKIVFLIYMEKNKPHNSDYFNDDGLFVYQGMGMQGNQSFSYIGNRIIRDHVAEGFRLFIFKYGENRVLSLEGEAFYKNHEVGLSVDCNGKNREVIYFNLSVDLKAQLPCPK